MTRRLTLILALALVALGGGMPARADLPCTDDADTAWELPASVLGGGRIALPEDDPTVLVAFAHGYGHTSASWVEHMKRTAAKGAVAFAMDYRGTYTQEVGEETFVRGWFVREGAQDTIDMARILLATCRTLRTVIIYGVSMGGNASGLAVAANATRADRTPLFDYWVAGEPAANVIETYLEATAVEPVNGFAARAREDIEVEHGGALWERPWSFADGSVLLRTPSIAASGIKGVAIVHGFDDGLVPYNQGREFALALRAAGVPTDFYNAARRETDGTPDGSDNTTLSENVARPLLAGAGQEYNEPLAGHGTESSQTNIVVQTGLQIVFALMEGNAIPGGHEFVVDGEMGTIPIL